MAKVKASAAADPSVAALAKDLGIKPKKAQALVSALASGYKGASLDRDALRGWAIPRGAPDDLAARDLPTLRRRSADLARNNPLAAGAIATKVQGVVGTGLKLHAALDRDYLRLGDDAADAWEDKAETLFRAWAESKDCHVQRTLNFAEQQEVAFRSVLLAGDHFIQLARSESSELPFQLALQHIVAARVCNPLGQPSSDTLTQGVERTRSGVRSAFQVLDRHPESLRLPGIGSGYNWGAGSWTRIPAYDGRNRPQVLHLFRVLDADQTRGIPDLATVIEPLKQLDRYTDAELDAAVKNAVWAVLVKTSTGTGLSGLDYNQWVDARRDYYRDAPVSLQEGASHVLGLFPDDDVQSFDPNRPNAAFEPFVSAIFNEIGVALELPREVLTKAFQSSYSAARAALMQAWAFFFGRRAWLAANFCQPVYAAFVDEQVSFGRLAAPGYFADPLIRAAYLGSEWVGDAQGQIDETKAVAAARERVALGISTLRRETAALTGEDYDRIRRQREKEIRQGGAVQLSGAAPAAVPSAEDLDRADREEKVA